MKFVLSVIVVCIKTDNDLWVQESKVDRANLVVVGDQSTVGYWLWQNSKGLEDKKSGYHQLKFKITCYFVFHNTTLF